MQRIKRQYSRTSLSIGSAFGGWSKIVGNSKGGEQSSGSVESTETMVNHPLINYLISNKNLMRYVVHFNIILLLPPLDIIKDIPISVAIVETHLIHLSPKTMMFVTLNGLCGKFEEQVITIFNGTQTNNHRPDTLAELLQSYPTNDPIFTTHASGADEFTYNGNHIITISIKFPICNNSLPWSWKMKPSQFSSPPSSTMYKILMELQNSFDELRKQIPNIEEDEKNDPQIRSGAFPHYFHIDCTETRINNLRENEMETAKFHSRLSSECNSELEKKIMTFIIEFPSLAKEKFLSERKQMITSFIKEVSEKVKNNVIWQDDNGFNFITFSSNLKVFLYNKLFRYLWPPSISQLENLDYTDSVIFDSICHSTCTSYLCLQPKFFGYDGPIEFLNKILAVPIKFFRKLDVVRSPSEKVMCIYCALKAVEQTCYYISLKCMNSKPFLPLLLYTIIQADLSQIWSNIIFIKEMGDNNDSLFMHYFDTFEQAVKAIEQLPQSFELQNDQEYKVMINIRKDEINWSIFNNELPNYFMPIFTLDDLRKYFGAFPRSEDRMRQLIFSNPSKIQRDDYADLISFFKVLQNE
ncbi:hypothetical protein ENUP19_0009G0008 [Entamoeba nuttalli]|uniref:Vacuolar sorting protein 9 (VPS9) domain containing protein n=2 Tax=Entamoeba nuttalli TaxID=412467 RepID=K2H2S9_ENTNP|nr:vacuolar sorting protein 9 (VPS9) domain containing protein [Entamoeba nuttalli P19]EKE41838.1 vacuolar sorting protein 9 (VPS9) domain containing protein [Entamoeba nuttalli P19]|eukprot:XP_008855831.1 vacuolar sorting protein 9 (VPS9) domain containing protein [Entamoeba nuttalli P19]